MAAVGFIVLISLVSGILALGFALRAHYLHRLAIFQTSNQISELDLKTGSYFNETSVATQTIDAIKEFWYSTGFEELKSFVVAQKEEILAQVGNVANESNQRELRSYGASDKVSELTDDLFSKKLRLMETPNRSTQASKVYNWLTETEKGLTVIPNLDKISIEDLVEAIFKETQRMQNIDVPFKPSSFIPPATERASLYLQSGDLSANKGDYSRAVEMYHRALVLLIDEGLDHKLELVYDRLGFICLKHDRIDEAQEYFQMAAEIRKKLA